MPAMTMQATTSGDGDDQRNEMDEVMTQCPSMGLGREWEDSSVRALRHGSVGIGDEVIRELYVPSVCI